MRVTFLIWQARRSFITQRKTRYGGKKEKSARGKKNDGGKRIKGNEEEDEEEWKEEGEVMKERERERERERGK